MYGFKISGCKKRKFSAIGFMIQLAESLNILFTEKRFCWLPYYHWSFYDEESGFWFNSDGAVEKIPNKEFNRRYETIIGYYIDSEVDHETRNWLLNQVGKKYDYHAIKIIFQKLFCKNSLQKLKDNESFICTELTLKAVEKCGFDLVDENLEIKSIYETQKILERVFDRDFYGITI
jgi:uncharacterized protein YycO